MADEPTRYVELIASDEGDKGAVETVYYAPVDLVRSKFDSFLTSLERDIMGASREVQLFYGAMMPLLIPLYGLGRRMVKKLGLPPLPERERGQDPLFLMVRYVADLLVESVVRARWIFRADPDGVIHAIDHELLPCEGCPDGLDESNPFNAMLAESLESEPAAKN